MRWTITRRFTGGYGIMQKVGGTVDRGNIEENVYFGV